MMEIVIPNLQGKQLFEWLHANKKELKKCKKTAKFAQPCSYTLPIEAEKAQKAQKAEVPIGDAIVVDTVSNLTGWMDSDDDVLLRGCYNKSISDSGANIPHIVDHRYSILNKVGKVLQVYTLDIAPKDLGINSFSSITPQGLIFRTEIKPSAGKIYDLYKEGLVTQHSIGLRYVQLELCMNDGDYKEEFANWQRYIGQVMNRDKAEMKGYFWAVPEIEVIENSAVLFGSNSQTPTLSVEEAKSSALEEQLSGALRRYYAILGAAVGTPNQTPAADSGTEKVNEFFNFLQSL